MNKFYENSKAHGWHDEPLCIPEKLALIHSELSEALEDYRDRKMSLSFLNTRTTPNEIYDRQPCVGPVLKPIGFPSELADVEIRVWDLAGALGFGLFGQDLALTGIITTLENDGFVTKNLRKYGIPTMLAEAHRVVSRALKAMHYEKGLDACDRVIMRYELTLLVAMVRFIAECANCDLAAAVEAKHEYNKTRPHRHGNKVC